MRRLLHISSLVVSLMLTMPGRIEAASNLDLPPPLDEEAALIARYWDWLVAEVAAPEGLRWPRIDIEPLPRTVRMAFVFLTEDTPWREMKIVISPRSVDRAAGPDRLVVVGELAHEIVHYVLLMSENGWDTEAEVMRNDVHHHCDAEFMRLTRRVGDFIWATYHSNDAVRSIDHMVQLACWRDGHSIGQLGKR